jgi:transcriptional regulator with XRE-family HTH domain
MNYTTKMNLIGPRVRQLRLDRGWSQRELSIKLRSMGWHVTRTILAQMEATAHRITDCDLVFLAKALRVEVADFFPGGLTSNISSKIQSYRLRQDGFLLERRECPVRPNPRNPRARQTTH